jgi:cytochrome b561
MTARTEVDAGHSRSGYSAVAIALHWTIAIAILANIALGLWFESLFDSGNPDDLALGGTIVGIHKSLGLTVLFLSLIRLAWRITHGFPALPDHMAAWERIAARANHLAFYVLMVAIPFSGWALVSASPANRPLDFFGLFPVPQLPIADSEATSNAFSSLHILMAWTMLALAALHIAGALKHHLLDRDDVLARMLPLVRPRS